MKRKRMKKIYWIWIVGLFFLLSCSEETSRLERKDLALSLEVRAPGNSSPTKAATYDEGEIDEIDVIIFKREGRTDTFYDHYEVLPGEMQDLPEGNGKKFSITLDKEIVDPTVGALLMVIANSHTIVSEFITNQNITRDNPKNRQYFHENLEFTGYGWKGNNSFPFDFIPMCGIYPEYLVSGGDNDLLNIKINLFQALARIDVGIDMDNNRPETRDKFSITNVHLFSTNISGRIARHFKEPLTNVKTTMINPPPTNTRVLDYRHIYTYQENQFNSMTKSIYVTESQALSLVGTYILTTISSDGTKSENESKNSTSYPYDGTFLVLEAEYNNETRYYRVDFRYANAYLPLIRNNQYIINIKEVNNNGSASLEEAMKNVYKTKSDYSSGLDVEIKVQ